ncbi:MAG: hypothetical protein LBE92_16365 [Chryseobacterium sp.]|jgi:hypothetical protein|uniref:bacteriocin-like protein n=1 Tax=Chryseobacterium sp. TaxID=1871047 RepID=UPI0028339067|nr:hypothetical protein [Chryseobacterium sp.]MDR2237698.1 hypothetical protein [Chryseobacterium sp.]
MKNLKKLSRQDLKQVKGSAGIDGPVYVYCGKNRYWCAEKKECFPVGVDCNAFVHPIEEGEL